MQALKIALEAKKKKQAILEKVEDAPSRPKKVKKDLSQPVLKLHDQTNVNESGFRKERQSKKVD